MIDEERLKAAAAELSLCQVQSLTGQQMEPQVFSRKFERKMKRLIHKTEHPGRRLFINIAAVFVAVLLALAAFLSVMPKARAMVTKWIFNFTGGCVSCYHHGGADPGQVPDYVLSQVPEGYRLCDVNYRSDGAEYIYVGPEGKYLCFGYYDGSEEIQLHYFNSQLRRAEVSLGKSTADIYMSSEKKESNAIIWVDSDTQVLFVITYHGDQDALVQLARSVNV